MILSTTYNLIAASEFDELLEFVPLLIFAGIAIIGGIVKAAKKSAAEARKKQERQVVAADAETEAWAPSQPTGKGPREQLVSLGSLMPSVEKIETPPPVPPEVHLPKPATVRGRKANHSPGLLHETVAVAASSHVVPGQDLVANAKLAMVYHEIFSAPVALRDDSAKWDE